MHDHKHQNEYTIPIGPQSPILKEPICLRVSLDGNYIKKVEMRLGYIHRGIENLFEGKPVNQCIYIAEHICGICSHQHSLCFVGVAEKIAGIKANKKALYIRTIIAELERIHSHLLWFGFAMHEIGFDTLFNYAMREREYALECFEELTGNRVHHAINKIGTVRYDFDKKDEEFLLGKIEKIEKKLPFYLKTLETNKVIKARFKGVGIITKKMVKDFGLVGPIARASGIKMDIRKDDPYGAYQDVDFKVITDSGCDAFARAIVRIKELEQSVSIIRQLVKKMPKNNVPKAKEILFNANSEDYARVEAPRGENFYYFNIENNIIKRGRVRTPTLACIQVLPEILKGREIGDIPVIVSSLDPCFGCMERITIIKDKKEETLDEHEFRHKYC